MSDTITPNKQLTEPTPGGDGSTWPTIINTDLGLIDSALGGTVSKAISGTTTSLSGSDITNASYVFTGATTALNTITWSSFHGSAVLTNSTSGNQLIACGLSGGKYVYVVPGEAALIFSDGTNFNKISQVGPAPNLLINPYMEIDQANEGGSVSLSSGTAAYIVDGWQAAFHSSTAVVTAQRVVDGPLTFPNSLKVTVSTGAAVASTDYLEIYQGIEANNLPETALGTAAAQTLTLTFWVKSSIGTYTMNGCLENFAGNRTYPFNITISASATWEKKTITIPGDVAGTWITSGNAGGAYLILSPAIGSTRQGTANTWNAGAFPGTSANTNTILSTSSATFQVTAVKLEVSPIPTPYGRLNFADEYERCQRYYEKSYSPGVALATATSAGAFAVVINGNGSSNGGTVFYKVTKRIIPTITGYSPITGTAAKFYDQVNSTDIAASIDQIGMNACRAYSSPASGTNAVYEMHWAADARL